MNSSRRIFLKSGAALAASAVLPRFSHADAVARPAVEAALLPFDYADVQLLEGPLAEQFTTNHKFFLALDEDRLLKPFRKRAGQPAPGDDMGGWYDDADDFNPHGNFHGFIPGHTFGQYVSGLARAYAVTGDAATKAKIDRLVAAFAATISPRFYQGYHLPAYTYDKTACGLIDAHQFAHTPRALEVYNAATDAVLPFLPEKALARSEQYARPHKNEADCWDETYTLPENFFLAWRRGAGRRAHDLAVRFLEDDLYFNPLAEGKNVLPGEHAYSHVNAFSSAMQAYLVLGSQKHLRAATNGFAFVRDTQSFATGGWGPNETFRKPGSGEVGASLSETHASFETPCGAYGHFKITRYLLGVTRDSRYGDSMEQVLYNTILGVLPLKEDGSSFYYSDYHHDAHKDYHRDKWPCCSGTLPQIAADYHISTYFHNADGVYVNLFVPSRLHANVKGARVTFTQRTSYPHTPSTSIEVATDRERAFAVSLRIPAWAGSGTRVSVNGKAVLTAPEPGKFAKIERTWQSGDRVEVEFAMSTRLDAVDAEHPSLVAVLHGPQALFAVGAIPESIARKDLLTVAQVATGSTDWQTKTAAGVLTLRPFAAIEKEKYRLYQQLEHLS